MPTFYVIKIYFKHIKWYNKPLCEVIANLPIKFYWTRKSSSHSEVSTTITEVDRQSILKTTSNEGRFTLNSNNYSDTSGYFYIWHNFIISIDTAVMFDI